MFPADDSNVHKPQECGIDRDGHWQQFGTQPILISAPQWACWPCNAPTRFYTVGKKPSVKVDLAIYCQAVDVRGQCMSESLKLGHNLDFSSCDIMVDFHKSNHIYVCIVCIMSCSYVYTELYLHAQHTKNKG